MRALIIGGGGFIGARVGRALARAGNEAITVTRRSEATAREGEHVVADRTDANAISRLVDARGCETVIDMIAYEPAATIALRDALAGRVARYVLISSADVYRNYGGLHRIEATAPDLGLLSEEAPRRARLYPYRADPPRVADDPDVWRDVYDKIPIEDALAGPSTTIARLPMVYGAGDRNRRFAWMVAPMRQGAARIGAPAAWLDWRTTYGHVDNVAAAISLCACHPRAGGRTYNCGEPPAAHRDWLSRFAALLGWRGAVVDDAAAPIATALAGLDLNYPLALDTTRIRAELGYAETLAPEAALQDVIDDEARR